MFGSPSASRDNAVEIVAANRFTYLWMVQHTDEIQVPLIDAFPETVGIMVLDAEQLQKMDEENRKSKLN